jgi:hypothetical protein
MTNYPKINFSQTFVLLLHLCHLSYNIIICPTYIHSFKFPSTLNLLKDFQSYIYITLFPSTLNFLIDVQSSIYIILCTSSYSPSPPIRRGGDGDYWQTGSYSVPCHPYSKVGGWVLNPDLEMTTKFSSFYYSTSYTILSFSFPQNIHLNKFIILSNMRPWTSGCEG